MLFMQQVKFRYPLLGDQLGRQPRYAIKSAAYSKTGAMEIGKGPLFRGSLNRALRGIQDWVNLHQKNRFTQRGKLQLYMINIKRLRKLEDPNSSGCLEQLLLIYK